MSCSFPPSCHIKSCALSKRKACNLCTGLICVWVKNRYPKWLSLVNGHDDSTFDPYSYTYIIWSWVKTNRIPFWGRCTTHFRTYFSGDWDVLWGYDLDFDPWPHVWILSSFGAFCFSAEAECLALPAAPLTLSSGYLFGWGPLRRKNSQIRRRKTSEFGEKAVTHFLCFWTLSRLGRQIEW